MCRSGGVYVQDSWRGMKILELVFANVYSANKIPKLTSKEHKIILLQNNTIISPLNNNGGFPKKTVSKKIIMEDKRFKNY